MFHILACFMQHFNPFQYGDHYSPSPPPISFLTLHQNGLDQENESFRLLVSTYGASENAFIYLPGTQFVAMVTYYLEVFTAYLVKITKNSQFQIGIVL